MNMEKLLIFLLLWIFAVGFFIILANQIPLIDTSGWIGIGSDLAKALLPIVPYLWLSAMIIISIYWIGDNFGR